MHDLPSLVQAVYGKHVLSLSCNILENIAQLHVLVKRNTDVHLNTISRLDLVREIDAGHIVRISRPMLHFSAELPERTVEPLIG
jgi:hypothetical protein